MTIFGSKSDSSRRGYAASLIVILFFSLTTDPDMNRNSQNPQVPVARSTSIIPGVRVIFFITSGCLSISFRLQEMTTLKEGDQWQMWEFIPV